MDSRLVLSGAIVFMTIVAVWMLRYETFGPGNRLNGAVCWISQDCW